MNLLKKLIIYFPNLVILSILFWPDYQTNLKKAQFPVFRLGGFSIRITEVIFFSLFLLFIVLGIINFLMKRKKNFKKLKGMIYLLSYKKKYIKYVFILAIIIMAYSLFNGVKNGNPTLLLDIRGLSCVIFMPLFFYSLKSVNQIRNLIKTTYIILITLAIISIISAILGNISSIGKVSNLTLIMNFYLFCLAISFIIYQQGKFIINALILVIALISSLITFSKWMMLAIFISIIASILLLFCLSRIKAFKYIIFFILLLLFILLVFQVTNLSEMILKKYYNVESLEDYYKIRIMREEIQDVSGGRFEIWKFMLDEIYLNPILGTGFGGKASIYYMLQEKYQYYIQEHNIILWSLIRMGFLGMFLFLFLGYNIIKIGLLCYKSENRLFYKALLHAHLIYILGYLAINISGLFFFIFEPAIIFWCSIAIIFFLYRSLLDNTIIKI